MAEDAMPTSELDRAAGPFGGAIARFLQPALALGTLQERLVRALQTSERRLADLEARLAAEAAARESVEERLAAETAAREAAEKHLGELAGALEQSRLHSAQRADNLDQRLDAGLAGLADRLAMGEEHLARAHAVLDQHQSWLERREDEHAGLAQAHARLSAFTYEAHHQLRLMAEGQEHFKEQIRGEVATHGAVISHQATTLEHQARVQGSQTTRLDGHDELLANHGAVIGTRFQEHERRLEELRLTMLGTNHDRYLETSSLIDQVAALSRQANRTQEGLLDLAESAATRAEEAALVAQRLAAIEATTGPGGSFEELRERVGTLAETTAAAAGLAAYRPLERLAAIESERAGQRLGRLEQQIVALNRRPSETWRDDREADAFAATYRRLENRFRGEMAAVAALLADYDHDLEGLAERLPGAAAVDLGCGRGEFLSRLADHGFAAIGIEQDPAHVAAIAATGGRAERADAVAWLEQQADASLGLVSAIHLIEHLALPQAWRLLRQARRCLQPGGLLILETPNPANLQVGCHTFHLDPTHRLPLPPLLLAFLVGDCGFAPVDTRYLHDDGSVLPEDGSALTREWNHHFHRALDYAVVAVAGGSA